MNIPEMILNNKHDCVVRYYYMRVSAMQLVTFGGAVEPHHEALHPRVTVCMAIKDGKLLARGVAICTMLDQPKKSRGRELAARRALLAVRKGETQHTKLSAQAVDILVESDGGQNNPFIRIGYPWEYPLVMFQPEPTEREIHIIAKSTTVEA